MAPFKLQHVLVVVAHERFTRNYYAHTLEVHVRLGARHGEISQALTFQKKLPVLQDSSTGMVHFRRWNVRRHLQHEVDRDVVHLVTL